MMLSLTRRTVFLAFGTSVAFGIAQSAKAGDVVTPQIEETIALIERDDAAALLDARLAFLVVALLNADILRGVRVDSYYSDPRKFISELGLPRELSVAMANKDLRAKAIEALKSGSLAEDLSNSDQNISTLAESLAQLFREVGIDPNSALVQDSLKALFHAERASVAFFGWKPEEMAVCRAFPIDYLCSILFR